MCFSPEGDLVGGTTVLLIGIDACRHLRGRREYLAMAVLPIVFGLHQIDETFVWWWLQGHVPRSVGTVAMWIYLLFAMVALPTLVPLLVSLFEPNRLRRVIILPFLLLGLFTSGVMFEAMLADRVTAHLRPFHIGYSIGLKNGILFVGLYIIATCGSLIASGFRPVIIFGFANLIAVIGLAKLNADGFASLWCFYAAIVSGAIALHLRGGRPHPRRSLQISRDGRAQELKV